MAGSTKMHFHGVDMGLLKKWKIPIAIAGTAKLLLLFGAYEAYHFNYNMHNNRYQEFMSHRAKGLKPPYEVDYQKGKEYKIDWNSFREDVN
ncbi:hypothetical protein ABK040_010019 [Willaertia magna]